MREWQPPLIPYQPNNREFIILGIDPGLSGALAFYHPRDNIVPTYDMPRVDDELDTHALVRIITRHAPTVAVIESVWPMPRDGVRQAWRFSAANSAIKTVCTLLNIPMSRVPSSVWKAGMKLPGGREHKEKSRLMALQLFPKNSEAFERKKDVGRAEAALIAYWAAQKFIFDGKSK